MRLCSACLLGIRCGYGAKSKPHKGVVELAKKEVLVPVCPEQLGGLPTPREPSERKGKKVISKSGKDITKNFKRGAEEVLKIAKILGIKEAVFKEGSPSCGSDEIYDGNFSGKIVKGSGIATDLLRKSGIKVISEYNL